MIEATLALTLLLLGLLGVGALAGASIKANMEAQDRTQATNLADRILEMIRTESLGWNNGSWSPASETANPSEEFPMMAELPAALVGASGFQEVNQVRTKAQAFDSNLNPVAPRDASAKFCVHYNMTWLQPNETARADVRVYWMRRGSPPLFGDTCGNASIAALASNTEDVRCVARATHLMRNGRGSQ